MIYYLVEDKYINKYEVVFEKDKIIKIRDEIIKNCSLKSNESRESTLEKEEFIRNNTNELNKIESIIIKDTNRVSSYSDTSEDKKVYNYKYIRVKYPYLVELINRILNNDSQSLNELLNNYKIEVPQNYNVLIDSILSDIKHNNYTSLNDGLSKMEEAKKYIELKELNPNIESTYFYYNSLKENLDFHLIDSLSIEDVMRYNDFFENNKYKYDIKNESILRLK